MFSLESTVGQAIHASCIACALVLLGMGLVPTRKNAISRAAACAAAINSETDVSPAELSAARDAEDAAVALYRASVVALASQRQ